MRKEYYDTYKALGICTSCGKNKAQPNRVLCSECAKKDASRKRTYDKERKAAYNKRKRELCDAFGICTTCCTREKYKGQKCKECYTKSKEKYSQKQKEKGIVPRGERLDKDLCYICGDTVEEGYTLCKKHLDLARERLAKTKAKSKNNTKKYVCEVDKRERKNAYKRRKRELAIAFGICGSCTNKPIYRGVLCIDCYNDSRIYFRKKQYAKGIIPVSERKNLGLCYMCSEPVADGHSSLCERHKEFAHERAKKGSSSVNYGTHYWRVINSKDVKLSQYKPKLPEIDSYTLAKTCTSSL